MNIGESYEFITRVGFNGRSKCTYIISIAILAGAPAFSMTEITGFSKF